MIKPSWYSNPPPCPLELIHSHSLSPHYYFVCEVKSREVLCGCFSPGRHTKPGSSSILSIVLNKLNNYCAYWALRMRHWIGNCERTEFIHEKQWRGWNYRPFCFLINRRILTHYHGVIVTELLTNGILVYIDCIAYF